MIYLYGGGVYVTYVLRETGCINEQKEQGKQDGGECVL
jgi:hypothetical protein